MTTNIVLLIMLGFIVKHTIVDFPLQGPYQYKNKGKYGHLGGILHAYFHGLATFALVSYFTTMELGLASAILDSMLHYHIDWAKTNLNAKLGWGPTTHEQFWWLLGADQFLHLITYVGITYLLTTRFI